MRTIAWTLCLLSGVAACAWAAVPAETGSAFADIYDAFAPFGVLHRTYADHLFYGTDVTIPSGLTNVCERMGTCLGLLQIELSTQTNSQVAGTIPPLVRFRSRLAGFCGAYGSWLADIDAMHVPDLDRLEDASAAGLFAQIYALQQALQSLFEDALRGFEDDPAQWAFGVAFSLRTLLMQAGWTTIDEDLRDILYGSEDTAEVPMFVDVALADAIDSLLEFVGVPLDEAASAAARGLAQTVYDAVMANP